MGQYQSRTLEIDFTNGEAGPPIPQNSEATRFETPDNARDFATDQASARQQTDTTSEDVSGESPLLNRPSQKIVIAGDDEKREKNFGSRRQESELDYRANPFLPNNPASPRSEVLQPRAATSPGGALQKTGMVIQSDVYDIVPAGQVYVTKSNGPPVLDRSAYTIHQGRQSQAGPSRAVQQYIDENMIQQQDDDDEDDDPAPQESRDLRARCRSEIPDSTASSEPSSPQHDITPRSRLLDTDRKSPEIPDSAASCDDSPTKHNNQDRSISSHNYMDSMGNHLSQDNQGATRTNDSPVSPFPATLEQQPQQHLGGLATSPNMPQDQPIPLRSHLRPSIKATLHLPNILQPARHQQPFDSSRVRLEAEGGSLNPRAETEANTPDYGLHLLASAAIGTTPRPSRRSYGPSTAAPTVSLLPNTNHLSQPIPGNQRGTESLRAPAGNAWERLEAPNLPRSGLRTPSQNPSSSNLRLPSNSGTNLRLATVMEPVLPHASRSEPEPIGTPPAFPQDISSLAPTPFSATHRENLVSAPRRRVRFQEPLETKEATPGVGVRSAHEVTPESASPTPGHTPMHSPSLQRSPSPSTPAPVRESSARPFIIRPRPPDLPDGPRPPSAAILSVGEPAGDPNEIRASNPFWQQAWDEAPAEARRVYSDEQENAILRRMCEDSGFFARYPPQASNNEQLDDDMVDAEEEEESAEVMAEAADGRVEATTDIPVAGINEEVSTTLAEPDLRRSSRKRRRSKRLPEAKSKTPFMPERNHAEIAPDISMTDIDEQASTATAEPALHRRSRERRRPKGLPEAKPKTPLIPEPNLREDLPSSRAQRKPRNDPKCAACAPLKRGQCTGNMPTCDQCLKKGYMPQQCMSEQKEPQSRRSHKMNLRARNHQTSTAVQKFN